MKLSQRRLARPSLGGLLATRQGSLTVAVLCAACAAGILMFALGRYKSNLRSTPLQTTVLIATGEIQQGTSGATIASEKLYKPTPVVVSQAVAGAITDASQLSGETAQANILPGQQLTQSDFTTAAGVPATLQPYQRAISVTVDEAHGDTDILQAGDYVDVYEDTSAGSILLDPDVLVIKPASPAVVKAGGTSITGASLVLAVATNMVGAFDVANDGSSSGGKLYVVLRPNNATTSSGGLTTQASVLRNSLTNYPAYVPNTGTTSGATNGNATNGNSSTSTNSNSTNTNSNANSNGTKP